MADGDASNLFNEVSYLILDSSAEDPFPWRQSTSGCFVGGGLIWKILMERTDLITPSTDIDLFVYGRTPGDACFHQQQIMKWLSRKYTDRLFFRQIGSMVEVYIQGIARHLQLVFCPGFTEPAQILETEVDLTHTACGYADGKFFYTPAAQEAHQTNSTRVRVLRCKTERIDQARQQGWEIQLPEGVELIKSDSYHTDYYPKWSDDKEHILASLAHLKAPGDMDVHIYQDWCEFSVDWEDPSYYT